MPDITTGELPQTLLDILKDRNFLNSLELAEELNLDHQKIIGGVKSLQTHENVNFFEFFN